MLVLLSDFRSKQTISLDKHRALIRNNMTLYDTSLYMIFTVVARKTIDATCIYIALDIVIRTNIMVSSLSYSVFYGLNIS